MTDALVVPTSFGALAGAPAPGGVTAFLGVPYGAAPVGPLRFAAPAPPAAWQGVRPATSHGHAPLQGAPAPGRYLCDLSSPDPDEDCLNLAIWTPAADPQAKLPVLVWFYGGAFVAGSNAVRCYDGARLAARGAVVVGVNYRLGVFGWLRAEAIGADGNQGLADQAAALRWVQEEIASFGGDPTNITVFGESAGAASIAMHLAGAAVAPSGAAGLPFRRAILQSGSFNLVSSVAEAEDTAARVLHHLGVEPTQLRELPAAALQAAQDAATPRSGGVFYRPVADGDRVPVEVAAALAATDRDPLVPVLCGTNRHEMGFFWGRDERFDTVSDEFFAAIAARWHHDPDGTMSAYRAARAARGEATDNRSVAVAMGNDWTFRAASMALAGWQSRHAGAHAYRLDWCSPLYDGLVGAAHVLDVPLVFGTYDDASVTAFTGYDVAPDAVRETSEQMGRAWIRFASDGDPGWTPYDTASRTTRLFGGDTELLDDPEGAELRQWDPLSLHR